jgi:hypothetical protein
MAEFTTLVRDVSDRVLVDPFKGYIGEFPEYLASDGTWRRDSEEWRDFKFIAPYPNASIMNRIARLEQAVEFSGGSATLDAKDPKQLANFMVYSIFADVQGITENGKPIDWKDRSWKEQLVQQLLLNKFVLDNCVAGYKECAGKIEKSKKDEDTDFLGSSNDTTQSNITELPSEYTDKKELTQPKNSDEELTV